MLKTIFTLEAARPVARDVYELKLVGDTSGISRPGQFVNIELEGCYLRRPISVCDSAEGRLTLIVRANGAGTRKLCAAQPGSKFDLLTGLGNGYDTEACGARTVLVGGGVGVPPLYWLAKQLIAAGNTPAVALGFGSAADVFYEEAFRALGCETFVSTVDGSRGDRGFVTDLIRARFPQSDYACCCGPEAMLRAVYGLPQIADGQFSFEERMGCGFGACMGCTCKTKYGAKRICKDGPVLRKGEIVW